MKDSSSGLTAKYYYDFTDRLMQYTETGTGFAHAVAYTYDDLNNLTGVTETVNGAQTTVGYTYDDDNRVTSVVVGNVVKTIVYDGYGRIVREEIRQGSTLIKTNTYTYSNPSETTTSSQLEGYDIDAGQYSAEEGFQYDDNGNITLEANFHGKEYRYDSANQLIWSHDSRSDTSWFWTYDSRGNILTENTYNGRIEYETIAVPTTTTEYHYTDSDWPDLLTGITRNGVYYPVTSDAIGNPLSDGTRTYTWQHGRQMATVTQNGETWVNTYNADGLLVKCSSDRLTYTYVYNGSQLTQVSVGGETMRFIYDESGVPMILQHNGQNYYYVTNPQGDVLAIVDSNGYAVATYLYDPWGKVLDYTVEGDGFIGSVNPFRYRGYIYNLDTELYYLQSRYYDPALRRFLNADGLAATGQGIIGNNMFAYCGNNPVNCMDSTGTRYVKVSALRFGGIPEPPEPPSEEEMRCDSLLEKFEEDMGNGSHLDNFQCEVSYDGIVTYAPDFIEVMMKSVLNGCVNVVFSGLSKIAKGTKIAKGIKIAKNLLSIGWNTKVVADMFIGDDLPYKDYYQYTVSISWDQSFKVAEGSVIEHYSYKFVYWWDDSNYMSPRWYLCYVVVNNSTELPY